MYNLYNKTQADLNELEIKRIGVRDMVPLSDVHKAADIAARAGFNEGYSKGWADAMKKVDDVRREQQEAMDAVFRRNGGGY